MSRRYRRICWPNPDAVCVEGGCSYCSDAPRRSVAELVRYVRAVDDARLTAALDWGAAHDWNGR